MKVAIATSMSVVALLIGTTAFAALSKSDAKLLNQATASLGEMRNAPDGGIPEDIWAKAQCVVVIPSLKKAAFLVGGEFGDGVMSCRTGKGWGPPIFMEMTKGSAGFQIGAQSTDLVLVVMNRNGAQKLLKNKVTLGAGASVAAGPVGRTAHAATDAQMTAEMLSYSRSKGLFAGVDVSGGTLRPDDSANARAYGSSVAASEVALGMTTANAPREAQAFRDALGRNVRATSGVKK
jgi:lipid-binding SYLF domain-containing protein